MSNKREKENEKSNFYVTYLINGEEIATKTKKLQLVNENDLNKCSKAIKILSKQVYSIQTSIIEDFNLIYTSDLDASTNVERKSNLNLITVQSDLKHTPMEQDKPEVKPEKPDVKPNLATLKAAISSESNTVNSNTSNAPKTNILVDSLKTNIKKEESTTDKQAAKIDDSNQISDTVSKKLKINEEKKDEPAKPILKAAPKKNEPSKKATNQSITSFFKKA